METTPRNGRTKRPSEADKDPIITSPFISYHPIIHPQPHVCRRGGPYQNPTTRRIIRRENERRKKEATPVWFSPKKDGFKPVHSCSDDGFPRFPGSLLSVLLFLLLLQKRRDTHIRESLVGFNFHCYNPFLCKQEQELNQPEFDNNQAIMGREHKKTGSLQFKDQIKAGSMVYWRVK